MSLDGVTSRRKNGRCLDKEGEMPTVTVREYHPESGALLGNASSLNFGRVQSGTHSRVKVLDLAFGDVSNVGNIKLAIVSNGGITVNADPQDADAKGTTANGHFGIIDSSDFNAATALFNSMDLFTYNLKDFRFIKGLNIYKTKV